MGAKSINKDNTVKKYKNYNTVNFTPIHAAYRVNNQNTEEFLREMVFEIGTKAN